MSTTLTNGLKLPDKGSVDWYADMQSNYAILDGAVGTVAEHTAALAGKAPLVHTHTKSDITDFPVYGTTSGTICEGNDSRLSDARTPVAHTHGKADITDLLNSNFIPSANNSYDLGSSSYQWNNLYAKNYYYNGVAWGLDKANVWTGWNQFNNLSLYSNDVTYNQAPSSSIELPSIRIFGGGRYCGAFDYIWRSTGENVIRLSLGSYKSDGSFGYWSCNFGVPRDFSDGGKFGTPAFYPNTNGYDLGTSTNKWKTLNGINPGALSLPNLDSAVSLTTILQAAIDKTQTTNNWTANFTGILCINWITKNLTGPFRCSVYNASDIKNATWGQTFWADNVWYFIVSFPVQNGKTYYFDNTFTRTSEDSAHIVHSANAIYTLGNV